MTTTIDQLLADADDEIKGSLKKAASKESPASDAGQPFSDDEPVKLAHFLEDFANTEEPVKVAQPQQVPQKQEKVASAEPEDIENNVFAKVAHAFAIVETIENIEELKKTAHFVKKAQEAGHSDEQIEMFLEKQAKKMPTVTKGTVAKALGALGLAGGAGVAGREYGQEEGRTEGRRTGYVQGVRDYDSALRRQLQQKFSRS